jgi:hypothetical protein
MADGTLMAPENEASVVNKPKEGTPGTAEAVQNWSGSKINPVTEPKFTPRAPERRSSFKQKVLQGVAGALALFGVHQAVPQADLSGPTQAVTDVAGRVGETTVKVVQGVGDADLKPYVDMRKGAADYQSTKKKEAELPPK